MTQREEFELFFVNEFGAEFTVSKQTMLLYDGNTDKYMNWFVNDSYTTWQAAKAQATPQWIPVSERLPPVGDQCLFYRPLAENSGDDVIAVKTAMKNAQYCWPNTVPGWEEPCNPSNGDCHVTHWMPLPAPPEQDK